MDYSEANQMQWALTTNDFDMNSLKGTNEYGEYFVDVEIEGEYYRLTNWCEFGLLVGACLTNTMNSVRSLIPKNPKTMSDFYASFGIEV